MYNTNRGQFGNSNPAQFDSQSPDKEIRPHPKGKIWTLSTLGDDIKHQKSKLKSIVIPDVFEDVPDDVKNKAFPIKLNGAAKFGVIAYMMADDLQIKDNVFGDLVEMVEGNKKGEIEIICLVDTYDDTGSAILSYNHKKSSYDVLENWSVTTKEQWITSLTLFLYRSFVCLKSIPNLGLIMSGHGTNYFYSGLESKGVLHLLPDSYLYKGVSYLTLDEVKGCLDISTSLAEFPKQGLDFILFDMCLMQTIEINSEMLDFSKSIIASENSVNVAGFEYKNWFNYINNHYNGFESIAIDAVSEYGEYYKNSPNKLASATKLDNDLIQSIISNIQLIVDYIVTNKFSKVTIQKAINMSYKFAYEEEFTSLHDDKRSEMTIDLIGFLARLKYYSDLIKDKELVGYIDEAIKDLQAMILKNWLQSGKMIIKDKTGINMGINGLAVWFPKKHYFNDKIIGKVFDRDSAYSKIKFVEESKWLKLCRYYLTP